jgi:spermidine/putrescine-binding protein
MVAAQFLFGTIDNLTDEQFEQIKQLLIKQKNWVEMYNEIRSDYLLTSGACPVVVSLNTEIWKAMLADPKFDFAIPEEGGFMLIDSFVIPAESKKEEMVYQLINFLYREDVLANNLEKFAFFSTLKDFEGTAGGRKLPVPSSEQIKKLEFFRARLPEKIINNIWISLKA